MNNGPLDTLIQTYVPLSRQLTVTENKNGDILENVNDKNVYTAHASRSDVGEQSKQVAESNNYDSKLKDEGEKEVKLKFSDIMTALQQVKESKIN